MKALNGEVKWYCHKEQSLMANDIRGLMAPKFSLHLPYSREPWKKTPTRKTDLMGDQTRAH